MALADCPTDTVFSARERDSFSRAPSAAVRALARQLLAQHGISDSEIVRERGERGLLPPRVFSGGAARNDIQLSLSHDGDRSEEHTSELQSLMRNSYAVFCLIKNTYDLFYSNIYNRKIIIVAEQDI